jgi:heme exporter protein D
MIPQGAHWGFVLMAYGLTALVMAALIVWVILDGRRHAKTLADLEARGIRRRSATKDTAAPGAGP